MENKDLQKTKFNVSWISVIVIFIGAIVYVPIVYYSQKDVRVVYYKVPVVSETVYQKPVSEDVNFETPQVTPVLPDNVKKDPIITKNLKLGDNDPEVKALQVFLNNNGFLVAESGPGSPGNETTLFGAGTRRALIDFQEANSQTLLKPLGLDRGTGYVGDLTIDLINS